MVEDELEYVKPTEYEWPAFESGRGANGLGDPINLLERNKEAVTEVGGQAGSDSEDGSRPLSFPGNNGSVGSLSMTGGSTLASEDGNGAGYRQLPMLDRSLDKENTTNVVEGALTSLFSDDKEEGGGDAYFPSTDTFGDETGSHLLSMERGLSMLDADPLDIKTGPSRKRSLEEEGAEDVLENNPKRKKDATSNLLKDLNLQDVVRRADEGTSSKSDLAFLEPFDLNEETEEAKEEVVDSMWLFDEEEEKKQGLLKFPVAEPPEITSPPFRDRAPRKRKANATLTQEKEHWRKTYAGRGMMLSVDSMLGLVDRKLVRKVRQRVMAGLQRDIGSDSSSQHFMNALLEFAKKDANPMNVFRMDKLCVLLQERLFHLNPEELALTLLVMAEMGYRNERILREIWDHIVATNVLEGCNPKVLAGVALASGVLNHFDKRAGNAIELEILRLIDTKIGFKKFDADAFTALLFGCSMAWNRTNGRALVGGLIEYEANEGKGFLRIGWNDLASMVGLASQFRCSSLGLIEKLHGKVKGGFGDMGATEAVLILQGLSRILDVDSGKRISRVSRECVDAIMPHIESDKILETLDAGLVPDLAYVMSRLKKPRMKIVKKMSDLLANDPASLPVWVLIRKVLEGYSRLGYMDEGVFQKVNAGLLAKGFRGMTPMSLSSLLMSGCHIQALDEKVLDLIVEQLKPNSSMWGKINRPVHAARIAWGLSGFKRLTPEILKECALRCKKVDFVADFEKESGRTLEAVVIQHGLFAGYHAVSKAKGAKVANACFPDDLLDRMLAGVRRLQTVMAGGSTLCQREIANELREIGIPNALKPLTGKNLYRADIALLTRKVVVLVEKPGSFSINDPRRPLGPTLIRRQQLQDLKIKVVSIQESEWNATPPEERGNFLMSVFSAHGVSLVNVKRQAAKIAKENDVELDRGDGFDGDTVPMWVENRALALNALKRNAVEKLAEHRGVFSALQDNLASSKKSSKKTAKKTTTSKKPKKKLQATLTKNQCVSAVVLYEGTSLFDGVAGHPLFSKECEG
ncbi:hypothetical protein BSKO_03250 [Bryopsis sp. KO-2023]|nr:hypothetical protein BSKO_03250 [Bryopsis sp. KO-2023]